MVGLEVGEEGVQRVGVEARAILKYIFPIDELRWIVFRRQTVADSIASSEGSQTSLIR